MSLLDYLNNDPSRSSSSSSVSAQMTQLMQQATGKQTNTTSSTGGSLTASQSSVLITLEARQASASARDAAKEAGTLTTELRAAMDSRYTAQGNKLPSVGAYSNRALSLIALNDGKSFSSAEVSAAKAELRARERESALTFMKSGELTAASLKSYSQQLLAARESMSAEERALRDSNPDLR
jgi:hypothetical protein